MVAEDCIFCKIVAGDIPCHKIYETDSMLAFLDIAPVRPGHALILPKAHHETFLDAPAELGQELLQAMQVVGKAVIKATNADGLNMGVNNYQAAGQLVFHAHMHLIPRHEGDGLTLWPQTPADNHDELASLAQAIKEFC